MRRTEKLGETEPKAQFPSKGKGLDDDDDDGVPVDSMLHVHDGLFLACGQIVAVSLFQGGPPPRFLPEGSFQLLVTPNIDMNELKEDFHLTPNEKSLL